MLLSVPKVQQLSPEGIWAGRKKVVLISVKKHNRLENLNLVAEMFQREKILKSPEGWVLLLEGHKNRFWDNATPIENSFLSNIAEEHKIEVYNPICDPYTASTSRGLGLSPELAACSVLLFDCFVHERGEYSSAEKCTEVIRQAVEEVAKRFEVNSTNVRNLFSSFLLDQINGLKNQTEILAQTRRLLIDASNVRSRKELLPRLLETSNQPNVFILSGAEHEKVFQPYFIQSSRIGRFVPLAATSFDYFDSADRMLEIGDISAHGAKIAQKLSKDPWSDFLYLEEKLSSTPLKTWVAKNMVALLRLGLVTPRPYPAGSYVHSNLMKYAIANPREFTDDNWLAFDDETMFTRALEGEDLYNERNLCAGYASECLLHILKKIGNALPEEGEVLINLISGPTSVARMLGAHAACDTYWHKWRHNEEVLMKMVQEYLIEPRASTKSNIATAIVLANPIYLFIRGENGFLIYKNKDPHMEGIMLRCASENKDDPKARSSAFMAIETYLSLGNKFDDESSLESIILDSVRRNDDFAISAFYELVNSYGKFLENTDLIGSIIKYLGSNNWQDRSYALVSLSKYFDKGKLSGDDFLGIAKKHIKENEHVHTRSIALRMIGEGISKKNSLSTNDQAYLDLLFNVAKNDTNEGVRGNAVAALSSIISGNMDLLSIEQLNEVEHLCTLNRTVSEIHKDEREVINRTYDELVRFSALRDLSLLLELETHPSKARVEELIRKKDRYRDAIGPLLTRIEELYRLSVELQAKSQQLSVQVNALTQENVFLVEENTKLRTELVSCLKEIAKISSKSKFRHLKRIGYTIAGTVVRTAVKGQSLTDAGFIKSLAIDVGWDELPEILGGGLN